MARNTRTPRTDSEGSDTSLGVMMLAALPLILWIFEGTLFSMVLAIMMFGSLAFGLRLIQRGQDIERAYHAARVARRPALPRKVIGCALIAAVILILAGHQFNGLWVPLAFAMNSFVFSLVAFGVDPMKNKGLDDPAEMERLRVEAFRTELETVFAEASARIHGLGDNDLSRRTDAGIYSVSGLVQAMEDDETLLVRFEKPLAKFADILTAEVLRLEEAWDGERYIFARRRYLAKLTVLLQSLEEIAWKGGIRTGKDAFDMEADLLLARMQESSAA